MQLNNRVRAIDVFKGIAMIMVIMVHFEQSFGLCKWFRYFQMGCPIFFVCSGFGIMMLINRRYPSLSENKKAMKSFYLSRIKSLAPGWYLAIIIVFSVNTVMIALTGHTMLFGTNRKPSAIILNLLFLHGFFPFCNNTVTAGGWYIGTTAILYCITPFIVYYLNKFQKREIFFVVSSAAGMFIWAVLNLLFRKAFSFNAFNYFFFLVHYPEYLLGILLFLDLNEKTPNKHMLRLCLLLGIITFAAAFAVFYSRLPCCTYFSAWLTAFAAFLTLYHYISVEADRSESWIERILAAYGRNSYGIFLLHAFWVWPFIAFSEKIAKRIGLSIQNIPGFIVMIPVVLGMCYITGIAFNKVVKKTTDIVFGQVYS